MIWKNGAIVPPHTALAADDRAFLLGDGAFETMLVDEGHVIFADMHKARLSLGMRILGIDAPPPDFAAIASRLLPDAGSPARAALRCTVSRGGGRGLSPPAGAGVNVVASLSPLGDPPVAPARLVKTARVRFARASTARFKCVGAYAENLLARADAHAAGADEGLMCNEDGRIVCASAANVFAIDESGIVTPALAAGATPGCVRERVTRICYRLGIRFVEAPIDALLDRPLFLTNSLIGLRRAMLGAADEPSALFDDLRMAYEMDVAQDRQGCA